MLNFLPDHINFTTIAILSALFGGIANILVRKVVQSCPPQHALSPGFLSIAIVLALFSPQFYYFTATTPAVLAFLLVVALDGLGNYFYFKSFVAAEASDVTPLLSLAPVFTFFLGWLFLNEVVSLPKFILALTIIVLLVVFSLERKDVKIFRTTILIPTLSAAILFGASAIPAKYLLTTLAVTNAPTLYMFRAALIGGVLFFVFRKAFRTISRRSYVFIIAESMVVLVQWLFLYSALARGSSGITITLVNTVPIFTFIFGVLFLKEKITIKKVAATGLIIALLAII